MQQICVTFVTALYVEPQNSQHSNVSNRMPFQVRSDYGICLNCTVLILYQDQLQCLESNVSELQNMQQKPNIPPDGMSSRRCRLYRGWRVVPKHLVAISTVAQAHSFSATSQLNAHTRQQTYSCRCIWSTQKVGSNAGSSKVGTISTQPAADLPPSA